MTMYFVSMSVDIEAPPEVVWTYLVEPQKVGQWITALRRMDWSDDRVGGVGSTFFWEEVVGRRHYALYFETIEWEEHRVFGYDLTMGNYFKKWRERWVLEKTPTGTHFTFNDHFEHDDPFATLRGWWIARKVRQNGREFLGNLKRAAEAEAGRA